MKISSPDFASGAFMPPQFTCDGSNTRPVLFIEDVPRDAKSLTLIVEDPDAPMGTWIHWTLWNISSIVKEIKSDTLPEGAVEGKTSKGTAGWHGPCPPSGIHRYFFKLYALDSVLTLTSEVAVEKLKGALSGHILAESELLGTYSRTLA